MIIYKLKFKDSSGHEGEKLFTLEAIKDSKLRSELGRIFGWSGYASSAEEEDDAAKDRRYQHVFEDVLVRLANNHVPDATISHKERWVSLVSMEVA